MQLNLLAITAFDRYDLAGSRVNNQLFDSMVQDSDKGLLPSHHALHGLLNLTVDLKELFVGKEVKSGELLSLLFQELDESVFADVALSVLFFDVGQEAISVDEFPDLGLFN